MSDIPIHDEWHCVLVQSSHGPNVFYRVSFGTVNWQRRGGGEAPAYVVFVQYGATED